jgi:hypothetical protein
MKLKIVTATVLILGFIVLGIFAQKQYTQLNKKFVGKAYILTSKLNYYYPDSKQNYSEDKIEYVSSDGSFHIINKTKDETRLMDYFFKNGEGYFMVDHQGKVLRQNKKMSPNKAVLPPKTEENLTSSSQYIGRKEILGFNAFIHRITDETSGLPLADLYYIEGVDRPIKIDNYDGEGNISIGEEPIEISWGEPDASLMKVNYPIAE